MNDEVTTMFMDLFLECSYKHQSVVDDEMAIIEILDTAGQSENLSSHLESQLQWGEGFVLVYSITDRGSFDIIPSIKHHLDEIKTTTTTPCMLVGNKRDLEHQRIITYDDGEKMAMDLGCGFLETSACDGGEEIENVFLDVSREVKRRKMMECKPRRRSSVHQQVTNVFSKMLTKIQNG